MMNENQNIKKIKLLKSNFPEFPTSGIYLVVKAGKTTMRQKISWVKYTEISIS
jgi:hypothetical protein